MTEFLLDRIRLGVHDVGDAPWRWVDSADEDDLQLALYCLYELHYSGFAQAVEGWEWEPSLLGLRRQAEARFESELRASAGAVRTGAADAVAELWDMAGSGDGPSLSRWVLDRGGRSHLVELFKHRSAYQLKEADPHTWGLPRLSGTAKAVMASIQFDEYGHGSAQDMHSALFATTMEAVGLDPTPNAYLDQIPGFTLATVNLISLLGLHRRLRGALVGHLALFEMTSVGPMSRYSEALGRLGLPAQARRFFDVHVEADRVHQHLATEGMVAGLLHTQPDLAGDVVFGARCLQVVESRFTSQLMDSWEGGRSSLYRPVAAQPAR